MYPSSQPYPASPVPVSAKSKLRLSARPGWKTLAFLALNVALSGSRLALAQSWTPAAPYPTTISHYGFAEVGQEFYVISGRSEGANMNTVRRYNATTNLWTSLADIPVGSQGPRWCFPRW